MAQTTADLDQPRELTIAGVKRRRGPRLDRVVLYAIMILLALFFLVPLAWMLSTALKPESDVFTDPGFIPRNPTLENFQYILSGAQDAPVLSWFFNSVGTSVIGSAFTVLLTSLSAYAFARIDFPLKNLLFTLLITTLLLPGVMFLVPQYQISVFLDRNVPFIGPLFGPNSWGGFMAPGLAGVFGVFFMRQFFLGIPVELEEAAYVDGANRFRTFWSVILPLAGPAVATLAVISFLAFWNDYLWPLVMCEGAGCTLPPGLRNLQNQYTAEYHTLMAGAVIAAVPVLTFYVIAQRWIVQAVTSSGVKG
jgi:multiple sugar transport system permease protein